jgi:hypothetical protein
MVGADALFADESVATAESVWLPFEADRVSQVTW